MPPVTPRLLLSDLDGVVRQWPRGDASLEESHGLPAGVIARTAFAPDLLQQAITGVISDEAWREEVRRQLQALHPGADAGAAVAAWSEPAGEVDAEVRDLLAQVRERCRVGLITNATSRLPRDLARLELAGHFDFIINSSEVGHAKPSPEIFAHALAVAGVAPGEAVFIDDTLANVQAAAAMDIRAHHFAGVAPLREWLGALGLI